MRRAEGGGERGHHGRGLAIAMAVTVIVAIAGSSCSDKDEPARPATTVAVAAGSLAGVSIRLADTGIVADTPIDMAQRRGSSSLLVAERGGRIVEALEAGDGFEVTDKPVIDLTERVGSTDDEKGLLGIAVSPDGSFLYASYTRAEDGASRIDEYELKGSDGTLTADPASRRELVAMEQPFPNHNGGSLRFGPDGMLYAGFGDGGGANDPSGNAQSRSTRLGKILRLDPSDRTDGVPDDNPFVGSGAATGGGSYDPLIWMTGLRNPWRFSFDSETGDMWIGDVGQNRWEEVDILPAAAGTGKGANLGWDLFEGDEQFADPDPAPSPASDGPFTAPVFTYSHDEGGCSITGGYVYRGSAIPGLRGAYLFSDYCRPGIHALRLASTEPTPAKANEERDLGGGLGGVVSFFEDRGRELYVLSLDGTVSRIVAS